MNNLIKDKIKKVRIESVARNVKRLREARNMTVTEFAEFCKLNTSTYFKLEQYAQQEPKLETLCKISEACEVTIDSLFESPKPTESS